MGITKLSCQRILGMRFGFSYTGGGSGSGLALVYHLEANVLNYSQKSNGHYQFAQPIKF